MLIKNQLADVVSSSSPPVVKKNRLIFEAVGDFFVWRNMKPSKRKVVTRSPAHTVRLISLPHLQPEPVGVEADSSLERDFVHLAALFPWLRSIQHQPFLLELESGSYTPDFLLAFQDGSRAVVEVKPKALLNPHLRKLAEAEKRLLDHGLYFFIALDVHIQKDGRSERALRIRRYGKSRMDAEQIQRAHRMVQDGGAVKVEQLQAGGIGVEVLSFLLTRRSIEVKPDLRLEPATVVRVPERPTYGEPDAIHFGKWIAG